MKTSRNFHYYERTEIYSSYSDVAAMLKAAKLNFNWMTNKLHKEVYVTYYHSGKEFRKDMSHISVHTDKFKFGCMMIVDNNAEGYVKDLKGKIFKIEQSNRSAKQIKSENYEIILKKFFN